MGYLRGTKEPKQVEEGEAVWGEHIHQEGQEHQVDVRTIGAGRWGEEVAEVTRHIRIPQDQRKIRGPQ